MRECFEIMGVPHAPQVRIGQWTVDFLVGDRIVVEVDGDYWHSKPEVAEKDKRKDSWLTENGYVPCHIRESELGDDPLDVIRKRWGDWARAAGEDPGPDAL